MADLVDEVVIEVEGVEKEVATEEDSEAETEGDLEVETVEDLEVEIVEDEVRFNHFLLSICAELKFSFAGARGGGGRGAPRGRGGDRGGRGARGGRGGARGGSNTVVEPHRHPGIFVAKGKDHMLVTKNIVPGESVYGEKRISVEGGVEGTKVEYRVWNPFRSKLAAGVLGGMDDIFIQPGSKVLYLGAASGTSVSHVADIVGPVSVLTPRAVMF